MVYGLNFNENFRDKTTDEDAREIILLGGGTAPFTDRPSILNADYSYTPIYRQVATFHLPGTS